MLGIIICTCFSLFPHNTHSFLLDIVIILFKVTCCQINAKNISYPKRNTKKTESCLFYSMFYVPFHLIYSFAVILVFYSSTLPCSAYFSFTLPAQSLNTLSLRFSFLFAIDFSVKKSVLWFVALRIKNKKTSQNSKNAFFFAMVHGIWFSDVSSNLFKRACPSVHQSVGKQLFSNSIQEVKSRYTGWFV